MNKSNWQRILFGSVATFIVVTFVVVTVVAAIELNNLKSDTEYVKKLIVVRRPATISP